MGRQRIVRRLPGLATSHESPSVAPQGPALATEAFHAWYASGRQTAHGR